MQMDVHLGLSDEERHGIAEILTPLLADEYVLYTKTRNYHWNVVGPQFNDLHKLFEEQYNALGVIVDDVAERLRAIGLPAIGTLAECLEYTRLPESPGEYPPASQMLVHLLQDYESIVRQLRNDIEMCEDASRDVGTADFLTGLLEQHEKTAWILRALLAEAPVTSPSV